MKTDVTEMQINVVAYVPKGSQTVQNTGDIQIVVEGMDFGWAF